MLKKFLKLIFFQHVHFQLGFFKVKIFRLLCIKQIVIQKYALFL